MIKAITYIEAVMRNRSSRMKGIMLKLYLITHGCKVGKKLKCASLPYFICLPNKNISIGNNVDLGRNLTIELAKNGKLVIEDQVLFHQNILISCNSIIVFKKWSGVAENVSIRDGNHQFKAGTYFRLQETIAAPIPAPSPISIGSATVSCNLK